MAREVRQFQVTVATGTTATNPQKTDLSMPARIVRRVTVRVPPGPRGNVGFQLGSGGQPFIPYNPGQWVVADDATIPLDLAGAIDSGAWQLIAYNTGTYTHDLFVTFELDLVQEVGATQPVAQYIPADQLNA